EQEGQQTETEATGAPQKHHYTLNQQVGSITEFTFNYIGWVGDGLIYVIVIKWFCGLTGKSKTASDYHIMIDMAQVGS
ncbi:hypothetical protein M2054_22565, partial [Klebsiella pneumoniae]|nr:hypothetical protein [Klebsiella pneumoniae]